MHPLGQRHSGTTAGGDAEGVEPGTDEEVLQLRCLAEDEVAVGSEALGTVQQLVDAGGLQRRNAAHREVHRRGEMIEVGIEQLEVEIARDSLRRPRDRVRLVATHHQTADFFLVVGQAIRVAQGGEVARHRRAERRGDDVLVLHRDQRHVDADRGRERARPLPGAAHDDAALDATLRRDDRLDHAVDHFDLEHVGVFADRRPCLAGAAGQGHRDVGRVGLPVGRQEGRTDHVVDRHQRPQVLSLARREQVHLEAERLCGGRLPLDLVPAFGVARQPQAAVHLPPGGLSGFFFQPFVEVHRVAEQLGDVGAAAQLADEPGSVERGSRRQLVALDQDRVGPSQLGQVIGGRATDDASTDDHGPSSGWLVRHAVPFRYRTWV